MYILMSIYQLRIGDLNWAIFQKLLPQNTHTHKSTIHIGSTFTWLTSVWDASFFYPGWISSPQINFKHGFAYFPFNTTDATMSVYSPNHPIIEDRWTFFGVRPGFWGTLEEDALLRYLTQRRIHSKGLALVCHLLRSEDQYIWWFFVERQIHGRMQQFFFRWDIW